MEVACRSLVTKPLANLGQYIQAVQSFPKLAAEEERELALKLRKDNDIAAAWKLVTSHLRYVVHIALDYRGYGLPMEDLIQEGNIGLMKAVKRFEPSRNVRLISYAVHWIRAQIHDFIQKNWRLVKVATTKARRKLFYKLRKQKPRLEWLSVRESKEIAESLGVRPEDVVEVEAALYQPDVPIDAPPNDIDAVPAIDMIADPGPPLEDIVSDWELSGRCRQALVRALNGLDARSREIIERRWLVGEEERDTLQALGDRFGVSAERVRQLEQNAVERLRQRLEEELRSTIAA